MSQVRITLEIDVNNEYGLTLGEAEQLVDDLLGEKLETNEDVVSYVINKAEYV